MIDIVKFTKVKLKQKMVNEQLIFHKECSRYVSVDVQ